MLSPSERTITSISFWRPHWWGRWSCQECGGAVHDRDVRTHALWHAVEAGHADARIRPNPAREGGQRRTLHVDKIGAVL